MKIVIVGASGFIGYYLTNLLKKEHDIIPVYKDTVDVFNQNDVRLFLEHHTPDMVINCLSFGGNDINGRSSEDVGKNFSSFYSFYSNSKLFKYYINFSSGIETTDSDSAYAFSKKIISRMARNPNWFNLQIFGCFGKHEKSTRLLKQYLNSSDTFEIQNDRLFDYISIQDLGKIVKSVLSATAVNSTLLIPRHIVCTYETKMLISEFLEMFCDINKIEKNYVIASTSDKAYTGFSNLRDIEGLHLYGLGHGLQEYML